ncbi:hypothetical protein ABZS66_17010 [Dactylosporangium sp. NPDC005572]|uniref:hypothetical protein n=1 Tax=Dactylosporangium sp. NPDC005572 TaxID=3156889 RepID=UPI0033AFEB2B
MTNGLPQLEALQSPEQVRMYGGLSATRLAEVAKVGQLPIAIHLDRFLDAVLAGDGHGDPDDTKALLRFNRLFFGDDVMIVEYYQSIAVGMALQLIEPLDEPVVKRAKRLMFTSFNAWSCLDNVAGDGLSEPRLDAEVDRQASDVAAILQSDDVSATYARLLGEARTAGRAAYAEMLPYASRLGRRFPDDRAGP